ncbi:MAG: type III-A CRISPR-associated protein Cas10/Csm1 [Bacteroidota bacterium]|nr:type III-A CRISPR-associated protein Cas10/Csm1 [Bacteroidota bacterium]
MEDREALFWGALFHDIGKFYQRSTELKDYKHAFLSSAFVGNIMSDRRVSEIARFHHEKDFQAASLEAPLKVLAAIVSEADNLSSKERSEEKEPHPQRALRCVFSGIRLNENEPKVYVQPICRLTPQGYRFPKTEEQYSHQELMQDYRTQWDAFEKEIRSMTMADPDTFLYLFEKYMWCIPSAAYISVPDISLYEHSRLTAAISVCMYDFLMETLASNIDENIVRKRDEERYLLVCGDLTGIQRFIYNIAHKGALKALKGRSFLLQRILFECASLVLKEFRLTRANLIYASGGKFYVLLPKLEQSKARISSIMKMAEDKLYDWYGSSIGIIWAACTLTGNDFDSDKITKKWQEAEDILGRMKKRRFSSKLNDISFFLPQAPAGDVVTCTATGRELCLRSDIERATESVDKDGYTRYEVPSLMSEKNLIIYSVNEETGEEGIPALKGYFLSEEQRLSQQLGMNLRRGLAIAIESDEGDEGHYLLDPWSMKILKKSDLKEDYHGASHFSSIALFNDDDFTPLLNRSRKAGWQFYGGDWTTGKEFEELSQEALGIHRIGVLRMDVDNLGKVFREGFGSNASLSRIVQLSRMMDFFFSSYLNRLRDKRWDIQRGISDSSDGTRLEEALEIVYAGGDDLFIVGQWNVIPDTAFWIKNEFSRFTGHHPYLSISGGVAVIPEDYPLIKAARLAGDAEESAKTFRPEKNSFCLFGKPMTWDMYAMISGWAKRFSSLIVTEPENDALRRAVVGRLYTIHDEYKRNGAWGPWRWRACYFLVRMEMMYSEQEKIKKAIEEFSEQLFLNRNGNSDIIEYTDILATLIDYFTRKESGNAG